VVGLTVVVLLVLLVPTEGKDRQTLDGDGSMREHFKFQAIVKGWEQFEKKKHFEDKS